MLSLNEQAALGPVRALERSQFVHLLRHFLERFFNHETASPDGDAKGRLVLIAVAAGLPPFMVAMYLWPVYHPFIGWPPGQHPAAPPSYWAQVNHHFFFVLYSFVTMGLVTVFEWDLFFPDLLDVFVLGSLPIPRYRTFLARMGAIAIFIGGFLVDANFLAPIVLPMATDPPNLLRFVMGNVVAVTAGGLFASFFILALHGVLLSLAGERLFRRISLAVQGLAVAVLVVMLLLFPVLSGLTSILLQSGAAFARWFPPFWFLGMYERILDGPAASADFLPTSPHRNRMYAGGRNSGSVVVSNCLCAAGPGVGGRICVALDAQPHTGAHECIAPRHGGAAAGEARGISFHQSNADARSPVPHLSRALWRCRTFGGRCVGAAVLHQWTRILQVSVSADGIRATIGIVAFWVIAGMRAAFVSSGNRHGNWALRIVHGQPPSFAAALEQLTAAKMWVFLCAISVTLGAFALLRLFAPPELLAAASDHRTVAGRRGPVRTADGRLLPERDDRSVHRRKQRTVQPRIHDSQILHMLSICHDGVLRRTVPDRTKREEPRCCRAHHCRAASLASQAPSRRSTAAL